MGMGGLHLSRVKLAEHKTLPQPEFCLSVSRDSPSMPPRPTELSHLRHQAISTPSPPSGTTFHPSLVACSRHVVPSNSTGIGFTAPDQRSFSPTRAADAGPNSHLPRIRPYATSAPPPPPVTSSQNILSTPLGRADEQRHGHWLPAAFRRFALLPHAPTKIPPSRAAGHQQKPTNQLNDAN